jgi:hypothetical protein
MGQSMELNDLSVDTSNLELLTLDLHHLTLLQVLHLDQLLDEVGDYGEVRLIVEKKRVKFVQVLRSQKF